LDISSVDRGKLLPRMSTNKRDNILSPITGLTIYCTDCYDNRILSYYNTVIKDCPVIPNGRDSSGNPDFDGIPDVIDIDDGNYRLLDDDENDRDLDNDGYLDAYDAQLTYSLTTDCSFELNDYAEEYCLEYPESVVMYS